jgi:hypothetical protein
MKDVHFIELTEFTESFEEYVDRTNMPTIPDIIRYLGFLWNVFQKSTSVCTMEYRVFQNDGIYNLEKLYTFIYMYKYIYIFRGDAQCFELS